MRPCQIVEVRHVEDSVGYGCAADAQHTCIDCGSAVCDLHVRRCEVCQVIFCPGCLLTHSHKVPVRAVTEQPRRKSA